MEKKEALNQIQRQIQEIDIIANEFLSGDSIAAIELDICLDKVKRLYESLISLKNIDEHKESLINNDDEYIDSFDVGDSIIDEDNNYELNDSDDNELEDIVVSDRIESKPDPEPVAHVEIPVKEKEEVVVRKEERKIKADSKVKVGNSEVIADKIKPKRQSINDMIAQNKFDKDVSSKFKTSQINDINKAININDRVWFIKELFKGDSTLYKTTISKLNNSSDLDSALNYIKENFDWDSNEKVVEKFVRVISRRFV